MAVDAWPTARGLTLVMGLLFTAGSLFYLRLSRERVLGPVGLFLAVLVIWFFLRGVLVALEPEYLRYNVAQRRINRWSAVLSAVVLTGFWAAAAMATYHSRPARWMEERVSDSSLLHRNWLSDGFRRVLVLYVLGLGGKIYRLITGTFVAIQQASPEATRLTVETGYDPVAIMLGTVLPLVGTIAFVLLSVLSVRDRRWGIFVVVLAIEVAFAYLTASRGGLLVTGAVAVLALHYWDLLSTRSVIMVSVLGLVAVFAAVGPYRGSLMTAVDLGASQTVSLQSIVSAMSRALELGLSDVLGEPLRFTERHILSRFAGLDIFAGSLLSIGSGQAQFADGETLAGGALSSLPRLLWPERPQLNLGGWFAANYLGYPRGTQTAIPMPRVVEFYVNFGFGGVVLGGVVMGVVLRGIRGALSVRTTVGLVIFIYLASQLILAGEKPFSQLFTLWKPLVILLASLWWVTKSRRVLPDPERLPSAGEVNR